MKKTRWWIAAAVLLGVVGANGLGQETTQTESLSVQLEGRKTWTIRYGFGDSLALSGASIGPGQLTLDQTLWVDFTASALSIFRVEGHFDDQEPADMQSLSLYIDTENVYGVLGDFAAPSFGSFFSGSRSMMGARVDLLWDEGSAVGVVSQLSGTRESREFVGETAFGERTFVGESGDTEVPYSNSLEGLGYIDLRDLYVAGFTEMRLSLRGDAVATIVAQYGVSELAPCLRSFDGRLVSEREAVVVGDVDSGDSVGDTAQSLVLRTDPASLVRETIRDAIRAYNKTAPKPALSYPFVVGSKAEGEFLAAVRPHAALAVGAEMRLLGELGWRRFYDLGQEDIGADSVSAAVRVRDEFLATNDPRLVGYSVRVHVSEGLLEVAFPGSFFLDPEAVLRTTFTYRVVGGAYSLGMSIIPGSERIVMAGRPLTRDVDYTIDYEYGLLALLVEIGPSDPLAVEFERYGGPGGAGAYARTFYGATASLPIGDVWSLTGYALRAADDHGSVQNPETVRVMPNTQTVVGLSGRLTRSDISADFAIGYTNDVFPYDDNAKLQTPNRVRSIAAATGWAFVGTDAGFSALYGQTWRGYDTGSGLSGRQVRAMVVDVGAVYLGTEAGLTVVRLAGVSPLDKVANWSRYGESAGLVSASVRALALDGETLWIGTDRGLSRVSVAELEHPDAWVSYEHAALLDVRALGMAGGVLYVGTEEGLVRFDPDEDQVDVIGVPGAAVTDLAVDGTTVYAAGQDGVRTIADGIETGWVVRGRAVEAVEVVNGDVFCGTSEGLLLPTGEGIAYPGWAITALCADGDVLWVGSEGDGAGELMVWTRGAAGAAYGSDATEINPWNPRAYRDAAAVEHTAAGWLAQGSFAAEGEGYSIAGSLDRVFPGFRAIDARGRTSAGGWSVASDIDLGPQATLSLDHEVRLSDLGSEETRMMIDHGVTFRGSFGPQVTLGVDYRVEDTAGARSRPGRDVLSYNLSVAHTMFDNALRLSVGWNEGLYWDGDLALRRETGLSTQATLEVAPGVLTALSWVRPVRILGTTMSGSERLKWETSGSFDFAGLGISAGYDLGTARALPSGATEWTHKGTLGLTAKALEFGSGSLAPTLDLEARREDEATSLSGKLGVRLGIAELSTRTTASVDVTGLGTRVLRWSEKLTSSATFTGVAGLRPSINYSGVRSVTDVQGQGTKITTSHSLNGRVTWAGADGASETLSVAGRLQSSGVANLTVENTFLYDITDLVSEAIARLRAPERSASAPMEPLPTGSAPMELAPAAMLLAVPGSVQTGSAQAEVAAAPVVPPAAAAPSGASPTVMLRTDVGGEWRRQAERDDVSWRIGAAADVTLSSTWSLSLGMTYRGGVRTAVNPFHGLVVEMTVAIDFER